METEKQMKIKFLRNRHAYVVFKKWIPKLQVNEAHKNKLIWVTRSISAIGILSSLLAFDHWYINLSIAVGIFLIQLFFEKAIIQYNAIYVQALPEITLTANDISGINYLTIPKGVQRRIDEPNIISLQFSDEEKASEFKNLIRKWNDGGEQDTRDNVKVSFVVKDEKSYAICIYPSFEKKNVSAFFEAVKTVNESKDPLTSSPNSWHSK